MVCPLNDSKNYEIRCGQNKLLFTGLNVKVPAGVACMYQ